MKACPSCEDSSNFFQTFHPQSLQLGVILTPAMPHFDSCVWQGGPQHEAQDAARGDRDPQVSACWYCPLCPRHML